MFPTTPMASVTDSTGSSANREAREEKKRAYLRALFDRHAERFRAAGNGDARALARSAHAAIDDVLQRDRGRSADSGSIRCRMGCANCCHGPVEIWPHEAKLLVEAARAAGHDLDRARLERQNRHAIETWQQQPAPDRACVFLGSDGACKVYESRPNACRKLLVTSDPGLCDAARHPAGSAERWFSWEAEMLEAAALETFGRSLMPAALLDALGRNG
jgi:Fe-S-cluster containining protein